MFHNAPPQQQGGFDMRVDFFPYQQPPYSQYQYQSMQQILTAMKQYIMQKMGHNDPINMMVCGQLAQNNGLNQAFTNYVVHACNIIAKTNDINQAVSLGYTITVDDIVTSNNLIQTQPGLMHDINTIKNAANNIRAQVYGQQPQQQPQVMNQYQQQVNQFQPVNQFQQMNQFQPQQPSIVMHQQPGVAHQTRPSVGMGGAPQPNAMVSHPSGNANATHLSNRPTIGAQTVQVNKPQPPQDFTPKEIPKGIRGISSSLEPTFIAQAVQNAVAPAKDDTFVNAPIAIRKNEVYCIDRTNNNNYFVTNEGATNVEYAKLETDAAALERNRPRDLPVGTAIWDAINAAKVVVAKDDIKDEINVADEDTLLLVDKADVINAPNLRHAVGYAFQHAFSKYDATPSDERVFHYLCDIQSPIYASKEDHDVIMDLYTAKNIDMLIDKLKACRDSLDPNVYWAIDERLTSVFMDRVDSALGIKLLIDSIVDDYKDALTAIIGKLKPTDMFIQKWISNTFVYMLHALRNKHHVKPNDEFDGISELRMAVSVTHLPVPVSDLDLKLPDRFSVLTTKRHSNIVRFCNDLLSRTTTHDGFPSVCKRFIRTIDNVWFEVAPNEMKEATIKQIKLPLF